MRAEEMRKITEQAEINCANKFWEEFKERLFKGLKSQAECGCYSLTIDSLDELSETKVGSNWIDYNPLREKVKEELEKLGYKFEYINNLPNGKVSISW